MSGGIVARVVRMILKMLGLGFLAGTVLGTRLACGPNAERARSEVAAELRRLAERLERAPDGEEEA
jgi:hypothetical protein